MRLALIQSRQNELYNFPDQEKRWSMNERIRLQQEMLEQNYRMMEEAAAKDIDLMVTTEAVNYPGQPGKAQEDYRELIIKSQPEIFSRIGSIAAKGGCWTVAGLYRADGDGRLKNSAVVWDDKGKIRGIYDKVHLAGDEKNYLTAGSGYQVFDMPFGRTGICICWDMQFPECARTLALMGADLIVCPTWGWEAVYGHARAYENGVYVAAMAVPYWMDIEGLRSPSEVIAADGTVLMAADRRRGGVFVCEADIRDCRTYRELRMGDRRPDTYRQISGMG